jgi:tetratricopeptide (TPR) repeat protein
MHSKNWDQYTFDELLTIQQNWIDKDEAEEDPDFRQDWVEEGIEIHQELLKNRLTSVDKERFYTILASLYLEYGRSEKMISGNFLTAFRYLQKATRAMPEKGDTFYHLAFLAEKMTMGREKWESAAFYAKEALERGINVEKQIKIWCLLGKAYQELGLINDSAKCFTTSRNLDKDDEYSRFRSNYSKKEQSSSSFSRLNGSGTLATRRSLKEEWIEKSRLGQCFVLEIGRRGSTFYGNDRVMALTLGQSELLKLFITTKEALRKEDVLHNTTGLGVRKPNAIKTDISRLRTAIKKELEIDGKFLIQTIEEEGKNKYKWNPNVEVHLIE